MALGKKEKEELFLQVHDLQMQSFKWFRTETDEVNWPIRDAYQHGTCSVLAALGLLGEFATWQSEYIKKEE